MFGGEVGLEAFGEAGEVGGGKRGGLGGLVEGGGDEGAVGGGQGGEPLLFEGEAFVAGEAVEAFEIDEFGAGAGAGERGEGLGEAGVDGGAAVLRAGVAGDEAGEAGGGGEGGVVAAEGGVAGQEAVLVDKPGAFAGGVAAVAEGEGEAVEEVGGGRCIRFLTTGEAEQGGEKAVGRGKAGEDEVFAGVRGLGEEVGFGLVVGAGHGGRS